MLFSIRNGVYSGYWLWRMNTVSQPQARRTARWWTCGNVVWQLTIELLQICSAVKWSLQKAPMSQSGSWSNCGKSHDRREAAITLIHRPTKDLASMAPCQQTSNIHRLSLTNMDQEGCKNTFTVGIPVPCFRPPRILQPCFWS